MNANKLSLFQSLRHAGFWQEGCELLKHSTSELDTEAQKLYGKQGSTNEEDIPALEHARRRVKFWKAMTGPISKEMHGIEYPDGEMDQRMIRVLKAAREQGVNIECLEVAKGMIRLEWKTERTKGCFLIHRTALIDKTFEAPEKCVVLMDPDLLKKGGLFKVEILANGFRLQSLAKTLHMGKLYSDFVRNFKPIGRKEVVRRWRAGQRFTFEKVGHAIRVSIAPGKAAKSVLADYKANLEIAERSLSNIEQILEGARCEGRAMAREFAARPEIVALEKQNAYNAGVKDMQYAGERFLEALEECCLKGNIPAVLPVDVNEVRRLYCRPKSSVSHRARQRLDSARERYLEALEKAYSLGWQPGAGAFVRVERVKSGELQALMF